MKLSDELEGYRIRPVRASDVAPLTLILNAIIAVGGTTAIERTLTEALFAEWFVSGSEVFFCHVAEELSGGRLLGFQSVSRHLDLPDGWGDIATFACLQPKVRGVGSRLFPQTERSAKEHSLVTINAAIRADNVQGLAFYSKMGFVTYRTLSSVPLRDGTPVDRILKRYDITQTARSGNSAS